MDALDLGKVRSGIHVCDVSREKMGSVAHVYRYAGAPVGEAGAVAARPGEELVEVKTGPLGLGKHPYIPLEAIDCLNDAGDTLTLNVGKNQLESAWESRPGYRANSPAREAEDAGADTGPQLAGSSAWCTLMEGSFVAARLASLSLLVVTVCLASTRRNPTYAAIPTVFDARASNKCGTRVETWR
jgi:hypothetical protein